VLDQSIDQNLLLYDAILEKSAVIEILKNRRKKIRFL